MVRKKTPRISQFKYKSYQEGKQFLSEMFKNGCNWPCHIGPQKKKKKKKKKIKKKKKKN